MTTTKETTTIAEATTTTAAAMAATTTIVVVVITTIDLPPLVSIEATGVCIAIGNGEVLLAAVYKSPGHAWNDADIVELLSFRHKSLLAGDLNAKHPVWNGVVSNYSGAKLLDLLHTKKFEISTP
jgi:hypothetical protein